jgi:hypothetical protein
VRAAAEKLLVHGQEYLCVLKYSASFAHPGIRLPFVVALPPYAITE